MVLCAAFGCNSRSGLSNVSFFKFPDDKRIRKVWIERLNRGQAGSLTVCFEPSTYSRICSKHFTSDQFTTDPTFAHSIGFDAANIRLRLKRDAIPTIFVQSQNKTQHDRPSASAIQKKKLKTEVKSSCARTAFLRDVIPTGTTCSTSVTTATIPTTTVVTSSAISGQCQSVTAVQTPCQSVTAVQTPCQSVTAVQTPLMWFADICETLPGNGVREETAYSVQCQTPYNLIARRCVGIQFAPIMVDKETQTDRCTRENKVTPAECDNSTLNLSLTKEDDNEGDGKDVDWTPALDDSMSSDSEAESDSSESICPRERLFIVSESCLDKLLNKCTLCGLRVPAVKRIVGTCLMCTLSCHACGDTQHWCSQKMSGTMPLGNLMLSAGIMFAGASPVKILRVLDFVGVQHMSMSTYHSLQSSYLTPSIISVWKQSQSNMFDKIQQEGRMVKVGGDGRCCSPGHTAKYGSYTMMDLETGKILDIKLVQSNEVANSYAMELEGLKRSMEFLTDRGLQITDFVTDRHSSVKKFMKDYHPEIKHWFDVWHVAKGVYKKLENAGKKKGCEKVKAWARSVSNHLYWCAASSNGDGDLVKEKWLSILNHVTDVHEGHGDKFLRCEHEKLDDRDWMKRGYKPYSELEAVVKGRLLVNDIKQLSPAEQTDSVESFHKLICCFASKFVHYFHAQMEARLYLAGLHFNENTRRSQAITKEGRLQYSISFPKGRKGEGIAKEVKTEMTFDYVERLINEVLERRDTNNSYTKANATQALETLRPVPLAQSTPLKPRPSKDDIIKSHVARFNR